MMTASLARTDTPHLADATPNVDFMRGLVYGLVFSMPLWGAIVGVARLVL